MMPAERTVTPAALPTSMLPCSFSWKAAYAGQRVNIFHASARVTRSSRCQSSLERPSSDFRVTAG